MSSVRRLALAGSSLVALASAIPYSEYILAPTGRTLVPPVVYRANGSVTNAAALTTQGNGIASLTGNSAITYDYTKDIGGIVSFSVTAVNGTDNFIGISYTESNMWISPDGSDSTQGVGIDRILWFAIDSPGTYTVDHSHDRGGFRYLNLLHNSSGTVELDSLSTNFTAMPHYADDALRDYTGYFHANDEKLNRVWYAAAYTNQLCTIPSDHGNLLVNLEAPNPDIPVDWWCNSTLTNGTSALVDGAKRDKLIWPGDFSISLPGVMLSTNDVETLKLSVGLLFSEQNATTGGMVYAGAPLYVYPPDAITELLGSPISYTYHMYNLLALNNYYTYSGDIAFLRDNWYRFKFGLNFSLSYVDSTGLAYVPTTLSDDWLRIGMGAHNIEANSILAYTLQTAIHLAYAVNDLSQIDRWQTYYDNIVLAANTLLWDPSAGLYTDNQTTTLHPQDGNCWAILSGVANTTQSSTISSALKSRWTPYGPPAPEAYGTTISPFISGFELQAHFLAGNPQYALDLMSFMWADFMLDDPRMTNSTFNEGYDIYGQLHYPAYTDDARISHAHGWSTGPLLALSTYVAGLHVLNTTTWEVYPQVGNLTSVQAGFEVGVGGFYANWTAKEGGVVGEGVFGFETPVGTVGTVRVDLPVCEAVVVIEGVSKGDGGKGWSWKGWGKGCAGPKAGGYGYTGPKGGWKRSVGEVEESADGTVTVGNVPGGKYTVDISCK